MSLYNITPKDGPTLLNYSFTLVENRIFLFGGQSETGIVNDLYVFTLGTCCWTKPQTQNNDQKPTQRRNHGAIYFEPTKSIIYYAGERNKEIYDDMYMLSTNNYLWQNIKPKGFKVLPRFNHLMIKVSPNTCFIIGGYGGSKSETDSYKLNDTIVYDNSTSAFSEFTFRNLTDTVSGPDLQGAYIERTNTIIVIGENPKVIHFLNISEKECIPKRITGSIPTQITGYSLNAVDNDKIIMFGGDVLSEVWNDFYALYDGQTEWGYFLVSGKIPDRSNHCTLNYKNGIIIFGGRDAENEYLNDMYFIETSLKAEIKEIDITEEPHLRIQFSAVLLEKENKIFIYGGNVLGISVNQGLLYDIENNQWKVQEIKNGRHLSSHSAIYREEEGNVILYGGSNITNGFIDKDLLKIDVKKWRFSEYNTINPPKPRIGHRAILYEENMFIFSGFIPNEGYTSEVWKVNVTIPDPEWEEIDIDATAKFIPNGRIGHTCTLVGKKVYLIGGNKHGVTLDDVWTFNFIDYSWLQIFSNNAFNVPIYGHSAVLLDDHTIMITGGCNSIPPSAEKTLNTLYFFKGREKKNKDSLKKRCYHETIKKKNEIFIFGGFEDFVIEKITLVELNPNAKRNDLMNSSVDAPLNILEKQSSLAKKSTLSSGDTMKDIEQNSRNESIKTIKTPNKTANQSKFMSPLPQSKEGKSPLSEKLASEEENLLNPSDIKFTENVEIKDFKEHKETDDVKIEKPFKIEKDKEKAQEDEKLRQQRKLAEEANSKLEKPKIQEKLKTKLNSKESKSKLSRQSISKGSKKSDIEDEEIRKNIHLEEKKENPSKESSKSKTISSNKKSLSGGSSDGGNTITERDKLIIVENSEKAKREIEEIKNKMKLEKKKSLVEKTKDKEPSTSFFGSFFSNINFIGASKQDQDEVKKDTKKDIKQAIDNRRASTKLKPPKLSEKEKEEKRERDKILFGYKKAEDPNMDGIFLGGEFNYDGADNIPDKLTNKESLKKMISQQNNDDDDLDLLE